MAAASYAVLGLLAIKPWSTYELTQQMDRSLGRFWPRAQSKLYEEPKKLVAHGLARASEESVGQRSRTVYAITARGRRALAAWLEEPGAGPVLEFEGLLKVLFSESGTKADALTSLGATLAWAQARAAETADVGDQYIEGSGPFTERMAQLDLTARFLADFYALVGNWARWASEVVDGWPDDPRQARTDPAITAETSRRARAVAGD